MELKMKTVKAGGELISLLVDGKEKIHQGADVLDENGEIYWKRHTPILFPIVGRIKDNTTIIEGKEYHMNQHGLARDMEFEENIISDKIHKYTLKSNEITKEKYPYDFELTITYEIIDNKIGTKYEVINTGNNEMLFGIGGHPAFKINRDELLNNNYYLEFEKEN